MPKSVSVKGYMRILRFARKEMYDGVRITALIEAQPTHNWWGRAERNHHIWLFAIEPEGLSRRWVNSEYIMTDYTGDFIAIGSEVEIL